MTLFFFSHKLKHVPYRIVWQNSTLIHTRLIGCDDQFGLDDQDLGVCFICRLHQENLILLGPRRWWSQFSSFQVDLSSHITKNIRLTCPVLGSPSDTVTESKMAIELALAGGMGIIHANQSIEKQVRLPPPRWRQPATEAKFEMAEWLVNVMWLGYRRFQMIQFFIIWDMTNSICLGCGPENGLFF